MIDRVAPMPPLAGWIALTSAPAAASPARRVEPSATATGTGADPEWRWTSGTGRTPVPPVEALTDPDRPTGPPPAFEANVLEAEADRRRPGRAQDGADEAKVTDPRLPAISSGAATTRPPETATARESVPIPPGVDPASAPPHPQLDLHL
ncbi:MAG: hypothetical protein ACKVPY_11605 [Paracoccaceae bacterium]